jgi:DNA-binding transcriptional MerR regulator
VIQMDQSNSYFTISGLAKELDVKKSHIRFCEENGLIPPRSSKLKRRVYNRYDRERLKLVFHFVLLGYSKEQIIDLIGIPDANLDENDQLMQGIEYGLQKLKKLEKRKEDLSFTKQTRIMNEIEMLREYINKIKSIKSGVLEEPSAMPGIRFEEETKVPIKPAKAITAEAEKKMSQHPVKVISLFVAGLALVILIGSYFYYQAGQKETKTIKPVQKKPIHSGKILVPQASEPVDQIAKTQAEVQETQKLTQSSSDSQQGSLKVKSTKSSPDSTQTAGIAPVAGDVSLIPEKEKLDSPKVEEAPKDDLPKEIAGEDLSDKAEPAAMGEDTLTAAVPEPVNEKATDIEVKEAPESGSAIKASPVTDDVSLMPEKEKEKVGSSIGEETPEDDVKREADAEGLKEKVVPDAADEKTLPAAVPEPGVEKLAKTKVKPSLNESEKEQITSEEDINQQKNELSRLKSFLDEYCQAYTNKDLDKFITFFTSDAIENNKPFHELLPDYRKNMEGMESLTYRIELMSYSKQTVGGNLMIRGRFFTRYQSQKGIWEENNGNIFMELLENKDSFLVKQLNY